MLTYFIALITGALVAFAEIKEFVPSDYNTKDGRTFADVIYSLGGLLDLFVPLIFAIAFVVYIWKIFQYFILGAVDEPTDLRK